MKRIFYLACALVCLSPAARLFAQSSKLVGAFYQSSGIVIDSKGNAYVTGKTPRVIKITPDGKAELFAGGARNGKEGKGRAAGFSSTNAIAIDAADNLYVADNYKVRKITPDGTVSDFAGTGTAEVKDGGPGTASFLRLESIAVDNQGNVYVADYWPGPNWSKGRVAFAGKSLIRKISAQGVVSTIKDANNEDLVFTGGVPLATDREGVLYFTDDSCIRKLSPNGVITSFALCDKSAVIKEGDMAAVPVTSPGAMAIANNGDLYYSDGTLQRIIRISHGRLATVAGNSPMAFKANPFGYAEQGYVDGKAKDAQFNYPMGIAFDRAGNLYIVDGSGNTNSYIRKLSPDGIVSTFCKHQWNPLTQQFEQPD